MFTAGQVPFVDGKLAATGKVGAEVDADTAYQLARTCVPNALAAIDELVGPDAVTGVPSRSSGSWRRRPGSPASPV